MQIKAWIFYLDIYGDSSYKWDRRVNILLAVTSSSSIAAWAIWNKFSFVWAFLIAVSQVVSVIKPYLPFSKRLELINPLLDDLQLLFNKVDYCWYRVSNGDMTENEINDSLFEFRNQYSQIEVKHLKSNTLLENKEIKKLADQKAEDFFISNY